VPPCYALLQSSASRKSSSLNPLDVGSHDEAHS
jgi:hypothetical protein